MYFYKKKLSGILIRSALSLYAKLGRISIFVTLRLSICLSLVYIISILQFSGYRSCTYIIKCIPQYFIFFGAIVTGIMFLILVFMCSLFIYGSKIEFYVLILYPINLLNSSTNSRSIWRFTGISNLEHHVICKQRHIYFFHSNSYAFYLFTFS